VRCDDNCRWYQVPCQSYRFKQPLGWNCRQHHPQTSTFPDPPPFWLPTQCKDNGLFASIWSQHINQPLNLHTTAKKAYMNIAGNYVDPVMTEKLHSFVVAVSYFNDSSPCFSLSNVSKLYDELTACGFRNSKQPNRGNNTLDGIFVRFSAWVARIGVVQAVGNLDQCLIVVTFGPNKVRPNLCQTVAILEIFMGGFVQWHMVVICIWCALFVTSQFDVIFIFPNQRFREICWQNMHILLHTLPLIYVSLHWI